MSGDRLAQIQAAMSVQDNSVLAVWGICVSDVLALVEIAKQAREAVDAYPNHNAALAAALARLDSGAAEGDA